MHETLKKAVTVEANALARRHHIKNKQRVLAIMERTAVECGEEFFLKAFCPFLEGALSYLPPERALATFESVDLSSLLQRTQQIYYFADPTTPFYTLEELAELMARYARHLEVNRESLIRTGFPRTSFERCKWLDYHLGHLNFTKLPVSVYGDIEPGARRLVELEGKAERDVDGNFVYDYLWGEISPPGKDVWLGWDGPSVSRTDGSDETLIPISRCTWPTSARRKSTRRKRHRTKISSPRVRNIGLWTLDGSPSSTRKSSTRFRSCSRRTVSRSTTA